MNQSNIAWGPAKLDVERLVRAKKRGAKIVAQCPACAETGGDKRGNHLVVYEHGAGKWGCVVFPGDKVHRRRIAELVGTTNAAPTEWWHRASVRRLRSASKSSKPVLRPMPPPVREEWDEGLNYLLKSDGVQRSIDQWRRWPAGTTRILAEDHLVSCPLVDARRGMAFPVQAPFIDELGLLGTDEIGFHFRAKPVRGERARWMYCANEKEGGPSIPALPFVMGAGFLLNANTIIVCEGQWDAITLAVAAGWLAYDAAWPERITLFATRGGHQWPQLIDAWSHLWPKNARFVLFQDADAQGDRWRAPGGFVESLSKLGHHVRLYRSTEPGAKDINDLHRIAPLDRELVERWIGGGT